MAHRRSTPPRLVPRLPLVAAGLLLTVVLTACGGDVDPTPSGAFPTMAAASQPSVADGVSQEGVPLLVNVVVDTRAVSPVRQDRPRSCWNAAVWC